MAARRWYSKHAGKALRDKLEEMANAPPDERISLEGEVDMARVLALSSIACFDRVCIQDDTGDADEKKAAELKAQATIAARDAITFVANIVDKAARTRVTSEGTIDVELTGYLVHQMQAVIERHIVPLPNGKALCDKITKDLQDIRLPDRQHGTASPMERAEEIRKLLRDMDTTVVGVNGNGRHT